MVNLEKLYIGKNRISKIEVGFNFVFIADSHYIFNYLSQNLGALGKLEVLSVQSNRLTAIGGLDGLCSLQELYLIHNAIKVVEGLEHVVSVLIN